MKSTAASLWGGGVGGGCTRQSDSGGHWHIAISGGTVVVFQRGDLEFGGGSKVLQQTITNRMQPV